MMESDFSSWIQKAKTPKESVTKYKAYGICSVFILGAVLGRIRTSPKRYMSETYCDLLCWGQEAKMLVTLINSADDKVPNFF